MEPLAFLKTLFLKHQRERGSLWWLDSETLFEKRCRLVRRRNSAAFSLVELLAVILIASTIAALAIAVIPGMVKSAKLRNAGSSLVDYLTFSRQTSMTRNCRVEVRFYQMPQGDGTKAYSSFRAFTISSEGTATPLGKVRNLDKPVIISELSAQNTLFRNAPYKGTEDLPQFGATPYYKFSFLSGGRTDLDPGKIWFISLYEKRDALKGAAQLPDNYIVMQIDDYTGHLRLYRP